MELKELYAKYKAAKIRADQAAAEEDKLKKLLKAEMKKAGEKNYTDESGYLFERIVQNRKTMDETALLADLKEKGITAGIKTIEAVDEDGVMKAIQDKQYSQAELAQFLSVKEIVMLKMSSPEQVAKAQAKAKK